MILLRDIIFPQLCFSQIKTQWSQKSTYQSPLLQVGPTKRINTVLPGVQSESQPLSRKQTMGQVKVPVRSQRTDLWVCGKEGEWSKERGKMARSITLPWRSQRGARNDGRETSLPVVCLFSSISLYNIGLQEPLSFQNVCFSFFRYI